MGWLLRPFQGGFILTWSMSRSCRGVFDQIPMVRNIPNMLLNFLDSYQTFEQKQFPNTSTKEASLDNKHPSRVRFFSVQ